MAEVWGGVTAGWPGCPQATLPAKLSAALCIRNAGILPGISAPPPLQQLLTSPPVSQTLSVPSEDGVIMLWVLTLSPSLVRMDLG